MDSIVGRARCMPLTITRSPALRPAVTQQPFMQVAQRDFAVLNAVLGTYHQHELLRLVGSNGRVVDQHGFKRLAATYLDSRVKARQRAPLALSKRARTRMVPDWVSSWLSMESTAPLRE